MTNRLGPDILIGTSVITLDKGVRLAKPNYKFEKRQKEIAKRKKKEEKLKRKLEKGPPPDETVEASQGAD